MNSTKSRRNWISNAEDVINAQEKFYNNPETGLGLFVIFVMVLIAGLITAVMSRDNNRLSHPKKIVIHQPKVKLADPEVDNYEDGYKD